MESDAGKKVLVALRLTTDYAGKFYKLLDRQGPKNTSPRGLKRWRIARSRAKNAWLKGRAAIEAVRIEAKEVPDG